MTTATLNVHGSTQTNEEPSTAIGATTRTTNQSKATVGIWIGRVMSGLVIAFMLMASVFPKLFMPELAAESMRQLGWNTKPTFGSTIHCSVTPCFRSTLVLSCGEGFGCATLRCERSCRSWLVTSGRGTSAW